MVLTEVGKITSKFIYQTKGTLYCLSLVTCCIGWNDEEIGSFGEAYNDAFREIPHWIPFHHFSHAEIQYLEAIIERLPVQMELQVRELLDYSRRELSSAIFGRLRQVEGKLPTFFFSNRITEAMEMHNTDDVSQHSVPEESLVDSMKMGEDLSVDDSLSMVTTATALGESKESRPNEKEVPSKGNDDPIDEKMSSSNTSSSKPALLSALGVPDGVKFSYSKQLTCFVWTSIICE